MNQYELFKNGECEFLFTDSTTVGSLAEGLLEANPKFSINDTNEFISSIAIISSKIIDDEVCSEDVGFQKQVEIKYNSFKTRGKLYQDIIFDFTINVDGLIEYKNHKLDIYDEVFSKRVQDDSYRIYEHYNSENKGLVIKLNVDHILSESKSLKELYSRSINRIANLIVEGKLPSNITISLPMGKYFVKFNVKTNLESEYTGDEPILPKLGNKSNESKKNNVKRNMLN